MAMKWNLGAALAVVLVGCTAPGETTSEPAASAASVAAPDVSPTPSSSLKPTVTPLPKAATTGTPTPTLAFEAPDDILPPWSFVVVVVDTLQLRAEPGLGAAVVGTASAGDTFPLLSGPQVADGLDWYRLATMGEAVIWAAAGSGADRYLQVVPPDCPQVEPDLAAVVLMTPWERLACLGDRSLTFEGTYGCDGCGGATVGSFEPEWLAYPITSHLLFPDYPSTSGALEMRIDPEAGLATPKQGSILRVTGHFSDPASSSCRISGFDGEQATSVDSRTAELVCRERFVLDAYEVLATDPDFP